MTKTFFKDALGWGIGLWFFGYALSLLLFAFVPAAYLGWLIMPVGIIITLWVLFKKTEGLSLGYYFGLAIIWTLIALVCDYLFIVKAFKPVDGYYKLDVYLYYVLTFAMPILFGLKKIGYKK